MLSLWPHGWSCRRGKKKVFILQSTMVLLFLHTMFTFFVAVRHFSDDAGVVDAEFSVKKLHAKGEDFAACLLVMDDSHFLVEWLAYHYHAVNLRTLIIAVDPNSQTSPRSLLDRWKDYIEIVEWADSNFTTPEEYQEALKEVKRYFGSDMSSTLARHRARQRLFYYKCLQTLKQRGQHWTLLTDTDEFVTLNYKVIRQYNLTQHMKSPDQAGSVAHFVKEYTRIFSSTNFFPSSSKQPPLVPSPDPLADLQKENPPLYTLQSSPCIQIPRIRFGAKESLPEDIQRNVPPLYNATDFMTLRWRAHSPEQEYQTNKISKTMLDLSRIDMDEIVPVTSIHMPIRSLCQQRRLHLRKSQSLLVIHHYLGRLDQYLYRENDARIADQVRSLQQFQKQSEAASSQTDDDEIRPWLQGFHSHPTLNIGHPSAPQVLLEGVGQLLPKSWTTYYGDPNQDRCALCFFGLPRAFKSLVLPSIQLNLLIPNARHNCDVYVHFFERYEEVSGRKNRGGKVDPREIYLLEQAVHDIQNQYGPPIDARTHRETTVAFTYDTEEDFWKKRGAIIAKFQNTTMPDGKPKYFPYNARTYHKSSIDNLVRQWHSIEYAFKLMEAYGQQMGVKYSRVGMFRSDALYMTPIDIALLDNGVTDSLNRHVVVPGFAQMPVNDRMIYGNYQGVKVWATQRFELIEQRAEARQEPGYVLHSERFLNYTIFPVMKAAGCMVDVNMDICFIRTRADESAIISDCTTMSGSTRGWRRVDKKALVENIVKKNCTTFKMGMKWVFVGCGQDIEYEGAQ